MAQLKDLLVNGKSRFIDKIYASDQFISKVVQGTSPFLVDSDTLVTNLNADLLDGMHASAFSLDGHEHPYLPLAGGTMTGAGPINFTHDKIAINFRHDNASYYSKIQYMTAGNEALVFSNVNAVTSFIFKSGLNLANGSNWNSQFNATDKRPSVQIKNQSLYVNSFINSGVTPAYNLFVDGSVGITGQFRSAVTPGTAPITVDSSTLVTNLNVDLLDGKHASDFATSTHNHDSSYVKKSGDTMNSGGQLIVGTITNSSGQVYSGGIQLRELTYSTTSLTDNYENAPGITFHWGGRWVHKLNLHTNDLYWDNSKIWHVSNDGSGSGLDADLLDGYHVSNLYTSSGDWIAKVGNTKTITVEGDASTYYPVKLPTTTDKTTINYISVWKNLGTATGNYPGNHTSTGTSYPNGSSSCWYIYEGRCAYWDGNGGYYSTVRAWYGYAPLVAHAQAAGSGVGNLIIWLRGGGTSYNVSCTYICTDPSIYYEETNIGSSSHPVMVAPKTAIENAGKIGRDYYGGTFYGNATSASSASSLSTTYYWADVAISTSKNYTATPYTRYMYFRNSANNGAAGYVGRGGSDNTLYFNAYDNGTVSLNSLLYATSSNVGIGTSSPSQKLHVIGSIYADSTPTSNASKTQYISAGPGYSTAAGKYGVKVVSCDQSDTQTGLGQDLGMVSGWSGWENNYNLSIAGGNNSSDVGKISFVSHKVNSTTYRYLGGFLDTAGTIKFNVQGTGLFTGSVGIGTNTPENKLDVNGIASIYPRGADNTAFKGNLIIKQQNSTEDTGQDYTGSKPSFGIQFNRFWTSNGNPSGETAGAGIFATVSSSWRGGLVFRTKNNQTQGGTHDTNALRLRPDGNAVFAGGVGSPGTNGNVTGSYIAYPKGGCYTTNTSSVTGYLKITLPQKGKNTMMSFDVTVYTYDGANQSYVTYHISGYEYSTNGWYEPVTKVYSEGIGPYTNLTVRLGNDGTYACVTIGEADTVWTYPQVTVHNIMTGYSNSGVDTWIGGWAVGFTTTALTTVVATRSSVNTQNINVSGSASSATNADTVDSEHAAAFAHRQTWNNMVHSGNEYTWIAPGYTGGIWINYRTASGATDGSINEYIFGTGKGTQLAKISLNTFHGNITGNAATATSAGTIDGILPISKGGTDASTAAGARANLKTWSLISDSYNTLMPADGTTNGWVKIGTSNTSYGILPSASGGAGSGHNYIGTSSWYWKYAYIDDVHFTTLNINNKLVIDSTGRIIPYSTSTRNAGNYGYYDSTLLGHVWSIGTSYSISADGKSPNTLYGLAYFHTNWSNGSNNDGSKTAKGTYAGGHQVAWFNNGVLASSIGDNIYTKGQFISKKAQGTAPLAVDSSTQVTNLKSNFAQYADVLRDPVYYTSGSRRSSGNITFADGGLHYFLATSSMSAANGKPAADGHVLHMAWDNSKWDAQVTVPTSATGTIQWRVQTNGTDASWSPWKTVLDSSNYSSYLSDTKVTQTITASSNTSWRPLLLGYSYSDAATFAPTTVTNTTYATHLAKFKPSTGQLAIGGLYKMNTNGTVAAGANDEVWNTNGTTVKISTLFTTEPEYLTLEVKNATSPSTPITEYVGVTITNKFTNEIIYEGVVYQNTRLDTATNTYTTNPIEIPPGIEYIISCSYITGYATPEPGIFLSIPGYSRTVNLNFTPVRVDILSVNFANGSAPSAFLTYTPASGTSVIQWIRNNSHRYAAYFAKLTSNVTDGNGNILYPRGAQMYICQLKDSDSTRFANDNSYLYPTDASVENGDIYMRLPEFYYRVSGDSSAFTVEFADVDPKQTGFQKWDSNNMIAVYLMSSQTEILVNNSSSTKLDAYVSSPYFQNNTISSNNVALNNGSCVLSSATISSSGTTIDKFAGGVDKASIKNLYPEVDVKFLRYKWIQILRLLFMAYYQTTDCVSVCGTSYGSSYYKPSEKSTQGRGMIDTTSSTGNGSPCNFWGVEELWGLTNIYTDITWQYYYLSGNANNVNKIGILADNVVNPDLNTSTAVIYKFGSVPTASDYYYGRTIDILSGTPTTMEQKLTYSPIAFSYRYKQYGNTVASSTQYWFSKYSINAGLSTGSTYHGIAACGKGSLFEENLYRTAPSAGTRICYYGPIQEVYSPTVFYNSIKPNSAIYRRLRGNTAIPAG